MNPLPSMKPTNKMPSTPRQRPPQQRIERSIAPNNWAQHRSIHRLMIQRLWVIHRKQTSRHQWVVIALVLQTNQGNKNHHSDVCRRRSRKRIRANRKSWWLKFCSNVFPCYRWGRENLYVSFDPFPVKIVNVLSKSSNSWRCSSYMVGQQIACF